MSKLVIFDLDGVLIDSKDIHYEALNNALAKVDNELVITLQEHVSVYDGLPTSDKLAILTQKKGLSPGLYQQISKDKQEETLILFNGRVDKDYELMSYFSQLKECGYNIAVASNSIRNTVKLILLRLGVLEFVDIFISNEDVTRNKPYPEMYWKCMISFGAIPENTVIIEDSHIGRRGAIDSKCHLIPVENRKDLTQEKINKVKKLLNGQKQSKIPWRSEKMNVIIPMAGAGSRFAKVGYTFPKPLIEVRGKPMIQVVVEGINVEATYTYIVQKEHYDQYNLQYLLNLLTPNCNIVQVEGLTEGACCTTLLAKKFINTEDPLIITNSDQLILWDSNETLYAFSNDNVDGGIITFRATHPKWSFAKLGEDGYVSEVAEKKPISNHATAGIYYWKHGSDYVKYSEQMIRKNIRTNNEFYVCPVYNEAIEDGKKIRIKEIGSDDMWGLGTPEDLNYFLENYKGEV